LLRDRRNVHAMNPPTTNLRRIRVAAGLSQSDLARLAKCSTSMISQVESGKRVPSERFMWAIKTAIAQHLAGVA
jgi:transcriptional regulator with XRE-family HTH domain